MNYYSHHIGDYRRDTAHLSLLEHGIYRQLLDQYYLNEEPLCSDDAKLMRSLCVRNADEMQALKNVLADFFELTDFGYIHKRCNAEIEAFRAKSSSARESAKARWQREKQENDANAMRTHTEGNANHKPITNNHKPITNKKNKNTTSDEVDFYDVPQKVIDDFKAHRKLKKAAISQTAIDRIQTEAGKAGIRLEDALTLCCSRGWVGFEAGWIKNEQPQARGSPSQAFKTSAEKQADWMNRLRGNATDDPKIIDLN